MKEELLRLGFSDKEAMLYILGLKTGETTANRLIELSSMPRATVYNTLEALKKKGLFSVVKKEKTSYYNANDPEVIISSIKEKQIQAENIVPKLKSLRNTVDKKVVVETFEGLVGVRKVLDEILMLTDEVIVVGNEHDARKIILHHPENFRQKRKEHNVKIRNLLEDSRTARSLKNDNISEVRFLSELKNFKEVWMIYNDTTVHMVMDEEITTIKIVSKEFTKSQRIIFEKLWEISDKQN